MSIQNKKAKGTNSELTSLEKLVALIVVVVLMILGYIFIPKIFNIQTDTYRNDTQCDSFQNPIPCPDEYNPSEVMDDYY